MQIFMIDEKDRSVISALWFSMRLQIDWNQLHYGRKSSFLHNMEFRLPLMLIIIWFTSHLRAQSTSRETRWTLKIENEIRQLVEVWRRHRRFVFNQAAKMFVFLFTHCYPWWPSWDRSYLCSNHSFVESNREKKIYSKHVLLLSAVHISLVLFERVK